MKPMGVDERKSRQPLKDVTPEKNLKVEGIIIRIRIRVIIKV